MWPNKINLSQEGELDLIKTIVETHVQHTRP